MKRKNIFYLIVLLLFSSQILKAQLETCKLVITDGLQDEKLKLMIEKNVSDFITACNIAVIKGEAPNLNKKTTTDNSRKRFSKIWNTSPIGCSVSTVERKCLIRPAGGYQIRDIPVTMFAAPEKEQNQEIAFNLTTDGKVDDIFIQVAQYSDLLSANEDAEDKDLQMRVAEFVESFRTAYNERDIKLIADMFSNNAVIIIGREVKQKPNSDAAFRSSMSEKKFEYQVKSKQQYISALQIVFKANKYIDVAFDSVRILKHENYPKVYGVTLKQVWNSNQLKNETGYVFLLIDYRDENHPLIHVRTWQPEEIDGRKLRRDERFQIGSFDLNRF